MGEILEYRSPREREEFTAFVGMVVFLGGWALLFCGLLMAYGLLRLRIQQWPPLHEPPLPTAPAALLTAVLVVSNGLLHRGYLALLQGQQRRASIRVGAATGLAMLFASGQLGLWFSLARQGLSLRSSPFGSLFFVLSGFHLLHVAVGIGALAWLTRQLALGLTNPGRHLALRLWGLYWHFVGATWLVLFVALYLI